METKGEPAGLAALMLVESLMLALMETELVRREDMVAAIEDVVATQRALAAEDGDPARARGAERMVHRIADRMVGALPHRQKR
jgi:hypothetical protein